MAEDDARLDDEEDIGPDDQEDEDDLPDDQDDPDLSADDDDPEDPPLDEAEDPPQRRQQKPLTRGQRTIIEARKRAQAAEDRAARAEEAALRATGAVDVLSRQSSTGQSEAQRRAEEERLAALTPEERVEHYRRVDRNEFSGALGRLEFNNQERADKSDFRALCRENPMYAKVAEAVERELAPILRNGQRVDRQIIAERLIGQRMIKAAEDKKRKEREKEDRTQRRSNRRPPARGGSDVQPDRNESRQGARKGKTAAERLAGVKF